MNDNEIICENITFRDYRTGNFDTNTPVPLYKKIYENENIIAYKHTLLGFVKFEFKPNCDKAVIKIWEKLNKN